MVLTLKKGALRYYYTVYYIIARIKDIHSYGPYDILKLWSARRNVSNPVMFEKPIHFGVYNGSFWGKGHCVQRLNSLYFTFSWNLRFSAYSARTLKAIIIQSLHKL